MGSGVQAAPGALVLGATGCPEFSAEDDSVDVPLPHRGFYGGARAATLYTTDDTDHLC